MDWVIDAALTVAYMIGGMIGGMVMLAAWVFVPLAALALAMRAVDWVKRLNSQRMDHR